MIVLVLGVALLVSRLVPSTEAAFDLTGNWTFNVVGGDREGTCTTTFTQTGQDVGGTFDCPHGDGTLQWTITPQGNMYLFAGQVTFSEGSVWPGVWDASGQIFPSGNNFTGQWQTSDGYSGTMVGVRDIPVYIKGDLNCDSEVDGRDVLAGLRWSLDLDPLQGSDCPEIGSDIGVIFGDINCNAVRDLPDALPLLRYVAGLPTGIAADCLAIGERYSPMAAEHAAPEQ